MSDDWFRIGIDVGGTFTHAVAVHGITQEVTGTVKVPTTHKHHLGTAAGIQESVEKLIRQTGITPPQIRLIAHCTTQATNALLEGDLAPVGLILLTSPEVHRSLATRSIPGELILGKGKKVPVVREIIDPSSLGELSGLVTKCVERGTKSFTVTRPFGVEDVDVEGEVAEKIQQMGYPAVASTALTGLYGLKVRTLTGLLNAGLLPIMLQTARSTSAALKSVGLTQNLLVMRSDGGVMSLPEVERRPLLTILSGPAAGVAGALFYQKIITGIFMEVGGTSTDISVLYEGRPRMQYAQVGEHRLYLRTMDVRTVGVAGGSLPRMNGKRIVGVGPRSAHIAGLPYSCFAERPLQNLRAILITPKEGDPSYLVAEDREGKQYAITPTCAANYLGILAPDHAAYGNRERAGEAIQAAALYLGMTADDVARTILKLADQELASVVRDYLRSIPGDREEVWLTGGGGGCAVFVPRIAEQLKMSHTLSTHHDVFSAIGAALALLHESEERHARDFSETEISQIRNGVEQKLLSMGADPATVEISVEIDRRRGVIRADGFGSQPMEAGDRKELEEEEIHQLLAARFKVTPENVQLWDSTHYLRVWVIEKSRGSLFWRNRPRRIVVTTPDGTVRWARPFRHILSLDEATLAERIGSLMGEYSKFGDAGREVPSLHLIVGSRLVDFSGLVETAEVESALRNELQRSPARDKFFVVVK